MTSDTVLARLAAEAAERWPGSTVHRDLNGWLVLAAHDGNAYGCFTDNYLGHRALIERAVSYGPEQKSWGPGP